MRWLVLLAYACSSKSASKPRDDAAIVQHHVDASPAGDAIVADAMDPNWAHAYDFDGDHVPDTIASSFSGGAHCCYKVSVGLSASHRVVDLPFELDGGYLGGLDLSQPGNFAVELGADGVAQLRMRIASYGASAEAIPLEWVRTYGIRSHSIRVALRGGVVHVENVTWGCAEALDQLQRFAFSSWEGLPECGLADLPDQAVGSLDRELGSARRMVSTRRAVIDLDHGVEVTFASDGDVVRIDFDAKRLARDAIEVLGVPDARLSYTLWGFTHPTGQWVWPARGVAVFVDPNNATIDHVALFAPTELATYKRDLAWP
jgi:hypothetical protein